MKTNDTYYQTHKINKQQMNLGTLWLSNFAQFCSWNQDGNNPMG